jgi:hypothetical protein
MDEWPAITVERFEGESLEIYRRRSVEIVEIIKGFRSLKFRGDIADQKERRLLLLQEPSLEYEAA